MPLFSDEQLKAIKNKLPKGGIRKIADKKRISYSLVKAILDNKKVDHHGIILLASKMAKTNDIKKKKEQLKAEELINSLKE